MTVGAPWLQPLHSRARRDASALISRLSLRLPGEDLRRNPSSAESFPSAYVSMHFPGKLPSILLLVLLAAQGKHTSVPCAQRAAQRLCSRVPLGSEVTKRLTLRFFLTVESELGIKASLTGRVTTTGSLCRYGFGIGLANASGSGDSLPVFAWTSWTRLSDDCRNWRVVAKYCHGRVVPGRVDFVLVVWWLRMPERPDGRVRQQVNARVPCVEGCGHPQRLGV